MPIPRQTTEEIFNGLCQGMSLIERDVRQFCKEATDEQLRIILSLTTLQDVRDRNRIEEELETRRHKEGPLLSMRTV
jgi:hypothetical protein